MSVQNFEITKRDSKILKGIAIIMMLVHHLFTFPSWILFGTFRSSSEFALLMNSPMKLCVGIFAFISGWALALKPDITWRRTLSTIIKFLIIYWLAYFLSVIFAVCFCDYQLTTINIIKNLSSVESDLMIFCWYVLFYILGLLIITITQKFLKRSFVSALLFGIVLPILIFSILMKIIPIPRFRIKLATIVVERKK